MKKVCSVIVLMFPFLANAVSIEVSVSAFVPTSSTLEEIYGIVWPDLALTVDHLYLWRDIPQLSLFAQIDYIVKEGKSLNVHELTRIRLIPLTIGLEWIQTLNDYSEVYFELGPRYYFMHIKNKSDFVPRSSSRSGCGVYGTIGTFFYPNNDWIVNFFVSYSDKSFSAPASTSTYTGFGTNVSGFNFGAGFGYKF